MKRIVLMALLALALPLTAFAGSVNVIDFTNAGGTLTGSSSGLTLTGSTLVAVDAWNGSAVYGNLGTVSFSTGSYISTTGSGIGSIATFNAGGTFTITGNGTNGFASGTVFTGTFSSPVQLIQETATGSTTTFQVKGTLSGTLNGQAVTGMTFETYVMGGSTWMGTSSVRGSGDTFITTTPEPGTLGLLGTGLVGLAGIVRKKFKA